MTASRDYDVVVVGAGPVGLVAALLLAKQGISVLLLEKERSIFPLPRAAHRPAWGCFTEGPSCGGASAGLLVGPGLGIRGGAAATGGPRGGALAGWARSAVSADCWGGVGLA